MHVSLIYLRDEIISLNLQYNARCSAEHERVLHSNRFYIRKGFVFELVLHSNGFCIRTGFVFGRVLYIRTGYTFCSRMERTNLADRVKQVALHIFRILQQSSILGLLLHLHRLLASGTIVYCIGL